VVAAPARAQTAASDQRTITVNGVGSVTAPNDTALLSVGVRTTHRTPGLALADTSARVRRVLAAVKAQGIAAADIQTQSVSLRRSVRPRTKHSKRKVLYTASNDLGVTVTPVSKAGAVVSAAVKAGANHVGDIALFPSNETDLYRQGLGLAYDDAHAKAELLAQRAGVTLGDPLSIIEGQDSFEPSLSDFGGGNASSAPVEGGTATVTAFVTVVYAIR
jgi:uncharacterized protein YggE